MAGECRASTFWSTYLQQDVDGRDKPGRDRTVDDDNVTERQIIDNDCAGNQPTTWRAGAGSTVDCSAGPTLLRAVELQHPLGGERACVGGWRPSVG